MKLFVSALLLTAAAVGFGQSQTAVPDVDSQSPAVQIHPGLLASPQEMEKRWMEAQAESKLQLWALSSPSQSGCPVVLTSAQLNWPASYLPVTSAEKVTQPNLALGFRNSSGKAIRSVTITARFLGKQSVYQLDASAFDLRLTFSGVDTADDAAEQLREIRVPEKMYAYGVTRVSLQQVLFSDGTFWTAFGHGNCRLDVNGSTERVAK